MESVEGITKKIKEMDVLLLAFVGDAVYSLVVRENATKNTTKKVGVVSSLCTKKVNAGAQEKAFFLIKDMLDEAEQSIASRARNANIKHSAKNFSIEAYRHATAFEAIIGYLHLSCQNDRLSKILKRVEENED